MKSFYWSYPGYLLASPIYFRISFVCRPAIGLSTCPFNIWCRHTGTHLICISIWRDKAGPSLQALNLMATIGYTISPLLCKPFLASSHPTNMRHNRFATADLAMESSNESTWLISSTSDSLDVTFSETWGELHNGTQLPQTAHSEQFKGNIQYAYLIVAIYDLAICVIILTLFVLEGCKVKLAPKAEERTDYVGRNTNRRFVITMSLLFFMFNVFYGGIEVGYAGLLMTFAVKYLGWSKSDGTNVTAVLQGSNAVVTALTLITSRWVRPQYLLAGCITLVTSSMLVLSFAATYHPAVLWVCTSALGAGYAVIMPCNFTWMNEFMDVTGKVSSAFWAGFFTGFMAVPAISGHLFHSLNPMWMPYMTLTCSVGMFLIFSIINMVLWCHKKEKTIIISTDL